MKIYSMAAALSLTVMASGALAQGLGQSSANMMDEVIVKGEKSTQGSLTSVSVQQAKEALEQIPGGIGFVEIDQHSDQYIQSLGDTLIFTPGVYADTSAQRESRISIRGSGLNATFERRGITVYRDNVPITRASGITEFQEIDPISVKYLEVYKGANAMRLGTASLGGAINAVTPTGQNTTANTTLRLEGGSFNTQRINISTVGKNDKVDYYASLTKLDSDGFRAHSDVDSFYGFANVGIALSNRIETRFYLTAVDDQFELAGSVSLQEALENPETAVAVNFYPAFLGGPGFFSAIDDHWDRNLTVKRLSNKTTILFEQTQLEIGTWLSNRKLDHAITRFAGVIDQSEDEWGLSLRLSNGDKPSGEQSRWRIGLTANTSENDAKAWRNVLGERTTLRSANIQNAHNTTLYGEVSTPLSESLFVVYGGQYSHVEREEEGTGKLSFKQLSPTIGVLWNIDKRSQVYGNISQSYEPPGISDLTSGGAGDFDALLAQEALTIELGTRGQSDVLAWDVSIYHSRVDNEFIDTESPVRPNTTITTNSASNTTHQGIEAGIDFYPTIKALDKQGLAFSWRNSVTVNDFSFDNHPTFGNNTLAGVPDSILSSALRLESNHDWYTSISVRHIADGPFLDYANTTQVDGYTLIGLTTGWDVNDKLRIFASVENLTDRAYVSNVSTVFRGNTNSPNFTPGQGRAFYLGFAVDL